MARVTFGDTIVANRVCRFSVNHFWADACAIQYEFIVVNGQTTSSAFHKFFSNVACQKLLKLTNVLQCYSENKSGTFFMDHGVVKIPVRTTSF